MKRKHRYILAIAFAEILFLAYSSFQEYIPLDVDEMKAAIRKNEKPLTDSELAEWIDTALKEDKRREASSICTYGDTGVVEDSGTITITATGGEPMIFCTDSYKTPLYLGSPISHFTKLTEQPIIPKSNKPYPYLSALKDEGGSCGNIIWEKNQSTITSVRNPYFAQY